MPFPEQFPTQIFVKQALPDHPTSQMHVAFALLQEPCPEQFLGQSATVHASPSQSGSQMQVPPIAQIPRPLHQLNLEQSKIAEQSAPV